MVEQTPSHLNWQAYYAKTEDRPPRPTTLRALDALKGEGRTGGTALDLGAGTGRDALAILEAGFRVLAIDGEADALDRLRQRAEKAGLGDHLETQVESLERAHLSKADLVNANFVLPFVGPQAFLGLWSKIGDALKGGGRFAGQLLGPQDTWVTSGRCAGYDRLQLGELLKGWTVEHLDEEIDDSTTPQGEAKRWHLWHLNLKRD